MADLLSLRIKFFVTGVLLPTVCVVCALAGMPSTGQQLWKSGGLDIYAALCLRWPAIGPLLPLVALSMFCLSIWIITPSTSRFFLLRLGIYTGVLLAIVFFLLILLTSAFATVLAATIVGPALALLVFGGRHLLARARRYTLMHLMIFITLCAVASYVMQALGASRSLSGSLSILFGLAIAATPTLNLITYTRTAVIVARDARQQNPSSLVGKVLAALMWTSGFVVGVRMTVILMLREYAKLPATNPNCYLSQAARRRHSWLFPAEKHGTRLSEVSRQTKRLKFLELVVTASCPRLHALVRTVYDRVGPPLAAACCSSRWLADISYLLLLPLEALAEGLRALMRIPKGRVERLYGVQAAHVERACSWPRHTCAAAATRASQPRGCGQRPLQEESGQEDG